MQTGTYYGKRLYVACGGENAVAVLARRPGGAAELVARTRTWWWIVVPVSLALVAGPDPPYTDWPNGFLDTASEALDKA